MAQPRYQIFVSSTFKDLQEERQAVLNAILKLNQFPAGMEIFPAVNDTAWKHIEKVIEVSDYYVLIIGGKYGSIEAESGISYTEKEYDFAVSKNIPVLAFTRSDEDSIPVGKAEMKEEIREKLKQFKQKVGNRHHWNYWKTLEELKANVVTSLAMSFATNPQKGWEKAGGIERTELLERLAKLQEKYDKLLEENHKLSEKALSFDDSQFAFGHDTATLNLENGNAKPVFQITWIELFYNLAGKLVSSQTEYQVKMNLYELINVEGKYTGEVTQECFDLIRNQFLALGVIEIVDKSVNGTQHPGWTLSTKGRQLFLAKVAQRPKELAESDN